MLQIAVCDDEPLIAEEVKNKINDLYPDAEVDVYTSARILLHTPKMYDILFLDIEMPGLSGMDAAGELRKQGYEGHIIFLTAHTEDMPEAFKVKAFRFLVKPVENEKLEEAIVEAEKEILSRVSILLQTPEGMQTVWAHDICYLEAVHNETYIYTAVKEYKTRKSMHEWEKELGNEHFFRVHRSYLIALRYIDCFMELEISLKDINQRIPVSRRKMHEAKAAYIHYVKKYASIR